MIIKLRNRFGGDVYVNTDNITFFKESTNGTIIFFESGLVEVKGTPEEVAKHIIARVPK
jgi:hypothetical protein